MEAPSQDELGGTGFESKMGGRCGWMANGRSAWVTESVKVRVRESLSQRQQVEQGAGDKVDR